MGNILPDILGKIKAFWATKYIIPLIFSLISRGFYWIKCSRFFRRVYSEDYSHRGEEEKSHDYVQHGNPSLQKTFDTAILELNKQVV